ncbi:hypothetical protein MNBD_ALPHA03-1308 [hydrothermal vent metagenome]|uniref:Uncharacterized protein n=1 Tax=hydrothermal vent metagenome TaxID=652676 RepID=A0A3B1AX72_9ZZZZ
MVDLVQRNTSTILSGTSTVVVTAGVDYVAPSANSDVRLIGNLAGSRGQVGDSQFNTAPRTTQPWIADGYDITVSFTITRAAPDQDLPVSWEIIDNNSMPAGNEVVLRDASTLRPLATTSSINSAVVSGVVNAADLMLEVVAQSSYVNDSFAWAAGLHNLSWDSANSWVTATRGLASTVDSQISFNAKEYTGTNWRVQRIAYTFANAGNNESVTIPLAVNIASTFIHVTTTYADASAGPSEAGFTAFIDSTTSLEVFTPNTTTGVKNLVIWVIEDLSGGIVVDQISGTLPAATSSSVDAILDVGDTANAMISGACGYAASLNPQGPGRWSYTPDLTATNQVTVSRGNTTELLTYRYQVVRLKTGGNAITGDISYPVSIEAGMVYAQAGANNYSIDSDLTLTINIEAASMIYAQAGANSYAITGDIGYSMGMAAGMVYAQAVAPVLSAPTASALGATSSIGTVNTDINTGPISWVESSRINQPTPTQIKAGQDDLGVTVPSNNAIVSVSGLQSNLITSGLTASTTYFRHYVHNNGLDSNIVTTASYATGAAGSGSANIAARQSGIIF